MTDRCSPPISRDSRPGCAVGPIAHSYAGTFNLPRAQAGKAAPWLIAVLLALGSGGAWWGYAQYNGRSTDGSADAAQPADRAASGRALGQGSGQGFGPGGGGGRPGGFGGPGGPGGMRFGGGARVQPVSVGVVRQQDIRVTLQAIGSIAASNTAVVKSKIEGELKAIHFREGQFVKAGALLAELDNRAAVIALAQAEGQLARDQAQLQNARLDVARFRDLLARDGIAKQQVDTQEALVRQLQGTVQANQAQVDNARLQLSYTRIVAPISGRIGLKQVDIGNVVRPSDVNGLLSIAQTSPVNVVFSVPDGQLPQINRQLKAGQVLQVEAWDRDQKQRLAIGQVASTDNAIDAATGTIKLKAAFANGDGGLFPNQFVNVRLQLGTLAGALAVPTAAVLRNAEGSYVYRVGEGNKVSVQPVRAGASEGDWVSVQGELKVGDQVVVDGTDRIRDGATVEVIVPQGLDPASARRGSERGGEGAPTGQDRRAALLASLPPDVAEKVKAMSPEERRAWFQQRRAERGGN